MGPETGSKKKPPGYYDGLYDNSSLEPRAKKNKNCVDEFPALPQQQNTKNPRFIVISAKDPQKTPLSTVSIFILRKSIDSISTYYENISFLRDGSILILVKNQQIADRFLKIRNLANQIPVIVSLHKQLNSSKGIVYAPWLITVSEAEIVAEMKDQGVSEVYKFSKKIDTNKYQHTGLMLFTFDLYQAPQTVEIGWYKAKVKEYIPSPMRCRNCQLLGHTTKRCSKDQKICEHCNSPFHEPSICSRIMCANCLDKHSASSKTCPKYLQNKNILIIKTQKKCSMAEAKRAYNQQNPELVKSINIAYAERVKQLVNAPQSAPASSPQNSTDKTNNSLSIPPTLQNPLESTSLTLKQKSIPNQIPNNSSLSPPHTSHIDSLKTTTSFSDKLPLAEQIALKSNSLHYSPISLSNSSINNDQPTLPNLNYLQKHNHQNLISSSPNSNQLPQLNTLKQTKSTPISIDQSVDMTAHQTEHNEQI